MYKKTPANAGATIIKQPFNYYDHFLDYGLATHPRLAMSRIDSLLHRKRLIFI